MRGAGVRAVAVVAIGLFLALLLPPVSGSPAQGAPLPPSPLSDSGPHPTAFVPFSPNVRVNNLNLGFAYQVEPTMVINSAGKIFVGWKEALTHNGGGQRVGFATSSDGGNTFSTNILMPLAQLAHQSDPWLTVTRNDRVYFTRIEYDSTATSGGIAVTNTTDGVTWGTTYFYDDAPNFADKESAAHDAAGNLYWVWNTDSAARQDLAFTRSDNGGATWTPKVLVSGPGVLGGIVQVARSGTVLATWWSYASDDVMFDRSFDGGATWGTDIRVNDIPGSAASPLPTDPPVLPSMAVAPNGTIYIAYEDYRNARPGGTPNGNMDIFFARSEDGGTTWSPGVRLNDDTTRARQWMPDLALDPFGGIHVAWEDDRTGAHNIYYTNSTDGGTTWGRNLRVTTVGTSTSYTRPGDYLAIESAMDGTICIVWTDGRGADLDIYFAKLERTFPYIVNTIPAGLGVDVDGRRLATPVTLSWKPGTTHTVSAPSPQAMGPQTRHSFVSWSDGGAASHSVAAGDTPGAITATFDTEHEVTVRTAPAPLDFEVDAAPYVGSATQWWEEGSSHAIGTTSPQIGSPGTRYVFVSWSDGGAILHTVAPAAPTTLEATFQRQRYLTVSSAYGTPTGSGWYNDSEVASFAVEATVALAPGTRYAFAGWTGDSTDSSPDSTIAMDAPKNVTASWRTQHLLTLVSAYGTPLGAGWYNESEVASFTIDSVVAGPPGTRYVFAGWTGDGTGSQPDSTITMDTPKTVTASWRTQHLLTLVSAYGTPVGSGWYNESDVAPFTIDSVVAGPTGTRYVFAGWTGDATSSSPDSTIAMDAPRTVTASWRVQYLLTIVSVRGLPQGAGWYTASDAASFRVEAIVAGASGTQYVFAGWAGDSSSSSPASTIAMDGPKTITASWRTEHLLTIVSTYGIPQGAGWYQENANATASLPSTITVNGTVYRFAGWTGASTASSSMVIVRMDGPKTLTATWEVVPPQGPSVSPSLSLLPWVVLGVIAVIAFLIFFVLWRRRRKEDESRPPPTS